MFTLGVSQQLRMGTLALPFTQKPALGEWKDAPGAGGVWKCGRILDVSLAF